MIIKIKRLIFWVLLLGSCIYSSIAYSRAGGSGGGHSGGGGSGHSSGGGGYSHSSGSSGVYVSGASSDSDSSGLLIFAFLFVIFVLIIISKRGRILKPGDVQTPGDRFIPTTTQAMDPAFHEKVNLAFMIIQQSWSAKKLVPMRRFITDGVYQRFNAQYTMMNHLDQTDFVWDIRIENCAQIGTRSDGSYDVIDVAITAAAQDQFRSKKFPMLNSPGGMESFTEVWSFIRRKDYKKGSDIYNAETCPKCSAPLDNKLLDSAQCPFCFTYLNSGEYDWVVAEITQEEDYSNSTPVSISPLVLAKLPQFSQQLIEDRASNAMMQILIACAEKNEAPLLRFTTARGFAEMQKILQATDFLYEQLFLNSAELTSCDVKEEWVTVEVAIRYSYRRVRLQNQHVQVLDEDLISENKKLTLMRNLAGVVSKGSIYANTCSHCGAAQKDSLLSVCAYCNQALNDPKTEWVVDQII